MEKIVRAEKIEQWEIGRLKPYEKNARTHSPEQIAEIAASITEFGFTNPILVDAESETIIAGHGRLQAANILEMTTVPVVIFNHLTPEQRKAYVIADNKLALNAGWDEEMLAAELEELKIDGFDLSLTGFTDDEVADLLERTDVETVEGETDPDAVPEVSEKPRTVLGDIYVLGGHRLMCGDSTMIDNVERLMAGEKAAVWASDPPYGISYVDGVANEKGQAKGYRPIANDELQDEALKDFIYQAIASSLPFMKKGFAFYMWHAMKMQAYFSQAAAAAAAAGILFHRQIIWVKPQFVFGRGQYHWRHELCLMGWLKGDEPPFYGEKNQSTVWEIGRENDKIHPTQKPVAIWEPSILNHTKTGEIIYEPFCGSGSNLIACEKNRRRCFAMELDPHYCDVIVKRWEDFTGDKAELLRAE